MSENDIDISNWCLIGPAPHGGVRFMNPPTCGMPISRDKALVMAAWIVAMTLATDDEFGEILDAVTAI